MSYANAYLYAAPPPGGQMVHFGSVAYYAGSTYFPCVSVVPATILTPVGHTLWPANFPFPPLVCYVPFQAPAFQYIQISGGPYYGEQFLAYQYLPVQPVIITTEQPYIGVWSNTWSPILGVSPPTGNGTMGFHPPAVQVPLQQNTPAHGYASNTPLPEAQPAFTYEQQEMIVIDFPSLATDLPSEEGDGVAPAPLQDGIVNSTQPSEVHDSPEPDPTGGPQSAGDNTSPERSVAIDSMLLPTEFAAINSGYDDYLSCPVCLESYISLLAENVQVVALTACCHVICRTCVERIAQEQARCPKCRNPFDEIKPYNFLYF